MIPQVYRGRGAIRTAPLISLVIPTRNERDGVGALLERLDACLNAVEAELLFVDDSDDGTEAVLAESISEQELTVLHRAPGRRDGGLSTAVELGFQQARGEFVCVMDADLQHPPELILELLTAARAGADVVIASRYIPGGGADGLDGFLRRFTSRAACLLTKLVFATRLRGISDPLSGFFIVRRDVVSDVRLRPIGFKILLEVLVRGRWATFAEVPYRFEGRAAGVSKATLRQGAQFVKHLIRLKFR